MSTTRRKFLKAIPAVAGWSDPRLRSVLPEVAQAGRKDCLSRIVSLALARVILGKKMRQLDGEPADVLYRAIEHLENEHEQAIGDLAEFV